MNAFDNACELEKRSMKILEPYLRSQVFDEFSMLNHRLYGKDLQQYGDAIGKTRKKGERVTIEFKAEEENSYGNFFLELYSNRSRQTPGWMRTSKSDWLYYHFVNPADLFWMDMKSLKAWAFGGTEGYERIASFPMKPQSKRDQMNDTWGACVPIEIIERDLGKSKFRHIDLQSFLTSSHTAIEWFCLNCCVSTSDVQWRSGESIPRCVECGGHVDKIGSASIQQEVAQ